MRKNIKKALFVLTLLFSLALFNNKVSASNSTISVKSNNTAIVGNNITVTVTLSSSSSLGSWDFTV